MAKDISSHNGGIPASIPAPPLASWVIREFVTPLCPSFLPKKMGMREFAFKVIERIAWDESIKYIAGHDSCHFLFFFSIFAIEVHLTTGIFLDWIKQDRIRWWWWWWWRWWWSLTPQICGPPHIPISISMPQLKVQTPGKNVSSALSPSSSLSLGCKPNAFFYNPRQISSSPNDLRIVKCHSIKMPCTLGGWPQREGLLRYRQGASG